MCIASWFRRRRQGRRQAGPAAAELTEPGEELGEEEEEEEHEEEQEEPGEEEPAASGTRHATVVSVSKRKRRMDRARLTGDAPASDEPEEPPPYPEEPPRCGHRRVFELGVVPLAAQDIEPAAEDERL